MENNFPWVIEYRLSGTKKVKTANNLTNLLILLRDGAIGAMSTNITKASETRFHDVSSEDLHLAFLVSSVVDKGQTIQVLISDFDGDSRPYGAGLDIGADEFIANNYHPKPQKIYE